MKKSLIIILFLIIILISGIYFVSIDKTKKTSSTSNNITASINSSTNQYIFSIPANKQKPYPSVVLTPEKAWNQTNILLGKEVSIKGPIEVQWSCTTMAGDNGCWGKYMFGFGIYGAIHLGILLDNQTQASCTAILKENSQNISNVVCNFLNPGETYTFTGTLKEWSAYSPMLVVQTIYDSTNNQIYDFNLINSEENQVTYTNLDEYSKSIDYSCNVDSDCEIKDIHNCCGYYPVCTNKNAKVDSDFVRQACEKEGLSSVCGFASINNCKCVENKCQGAYN